MREDIFSWRVKEGTAATEELFIPPQFDVDGRAWVQTEAKRKTAEATVKVTKPGGSLDVPSVTPVLAGTGKICIKHKDFPDITSDVTYFYGLKERHAVMYPLQVSRSTRFTDTSDG